MNRNLWIGSCAALVMALSTSFAAQAPTPKEPAQSSNDKVTITGCVQKADAAVGTTGTAGAAGAADSIKFILTNVMPASGAASSPTGTTGSASASRPASSYRLDSDESKLSAHVGHKVTITGTAEPASASTPSATAPAGSSSSASAPKLKVDSVTMVAATCP